jgi:hypothetical protein
VILPFLGTRMEKDWTIANRVSDRIVDVINDELETMRKTNKVQARQLLVGQLLALRSLEKSMPPGPRPKTLTRLDSAMEDYLLEAIGARTSSLPLLVRLWKRWLGN